jgi:hypothetical protein
MNTRPSSLRDSIRSSVFSMLGIEQTPRSPEAVQTIRQAMLLALGPMGSHENPALLHRINRTDDAIGLWFARAELYAHLSKTRCEPEAQRRVRALTPLFEGWVPANLIGARKVGARPEQPAGSGDK